MTAATKTIHDLPHFRVSAVKQSKASETEFVLSGVLDRALSVIEGSCSLLLPGDDVLTALSGVLRFQESSAGTALFQTSVESVPAVVGLALAHLEAKWRPHHVWMVAVPTWKWTRSLFHAIDATARIVQGTHVSVVDGEEVKEWIEIKPKGKLSSLTKYCPIFPSGKVTLPPIGADGVIKGGWDHAHCELCHGHIDTENYGYLDPGEHWVCEKCYSKFVANHDLSFIQT
jgi:hypothetical protein